MTGTGTGRRTRKARKPGAGRHLEALVIASNCRSNGATLVKVPNGVRWLPGGKTIPVKSPVDFSGTLDGGRHIVFDAKECALPDYFEVNAAKVAAHQIAELVRHGQQGAVAGLLIEATAHGTLHWLNWTRLVDCPPSLRWDAIPVVGLASKAVSWRGVARVAGEVTWLGKSGLAAVAPTGGQ
jgi:hypothetical protein